MAGAGREGREREGLFFVWWEVARRGGRFSISALLAVCVAREGREGKTCSSHCGLSPCGMGGFQLLFYWPPARRAARRGRLWGFAPFSAPLASPPKHPLQVFNFPRLARAARLVLRELPSLWSGDLPARRAMPPCALALHEGRGASASLGDATERQQLVPCC